MKRKHYIWLISLLTLFVFGSCESFLDKSPDMGLSEDEIYKNYQSITGFIDYAYDQFLPNYLSRDAYANGRNYQGAISDEFSTTLNSANPVLNIHSGNWLLKTNSDEFEIGKTGKSPGGSSAAAIRVMNRVIHNIDKVIDITAEEKNKVLGQAYFYRAWFYFQLITRYGGMPKLDKVFIGNGDEDIPRMTYHESHDWMMGDIEEATRLLPDYWDDNNVGRPDKIAAMAFRAMAQLYDASPLMQNDLTETVVKPYDTERAALAAQYAEAVVQYLNNYPAEAPHRKRLMNGAEYKNIFYFQRGSGNAYVQDESIWYCRKAVSDNSLLIRTFWQTYMMDTFTGPDAGSCFMPTQNMANMFEKKGVDGIYYPITDPRSGYNLQDPFTDRDPRFYNNLILPGQQWGNYLGNTFYSTLFKDGQGYNLIRTNSNSNKRGQSGYLCKKFTWEEALWGTSSNRDGYNKYNFITNYIRVAQVYLDYAEASFEATGSATTKVTGCSLSAEEALNIVRNRVGLTNVVSDIVNDPAKFRETLRRERTVELMFECHRWNDIRRWMIAHELFSDPNPIKGLLATPNNVGSADVPTLPATSVDPKIAKLKYTYEEYSIVPEVRVFSMKNYWYPFTISDVSSMHNLVQNPGW